MAVSNGRGGENGHLYMQIATDECGFDTLRDEDEEANAKKGCCQQMVETMVFQLTIGAVIAGNAVVIGMETDIDGHDSLWQQLEDAFLAIYILELTLKLCVYGPCGFCRRSNPDHGWNFFDFLIVSLGVVDRAITWQLGDTPSQGNSNRRTMVLLMRTFRLLRLLRIIRILRLMKQLYLLANSMLEAASAVAWVSVLCTLILYICAIVLTRLVGQPSDDEWQPGNNVQEFRVEHFGSVGTSMLTLFRLMAFPDMEKLKPVYNIMPFMEGFFVVFIISMSVAMVSLLTGVITESLLDKGKQREDERRFEKERSKRQLAEELRRAFQERGDGSGVLNRNQFERCKDDAIHTCSQHGVRLRSKDLDALFELVDDGSGSIDGEELLYGIVQLNSEVRPMAIMELRRLVVRSLHGISEQMAGMDARQQMMDRRLIELQAAARFGALHPPSSDVGAAAALPRSNTAPGPTLITAPMAPLGAGGSPPCVDLLTKLMS